MQIVPYLTFAGNCREALEYYAKCFRGEIQVMMSHGESPMAAEVPKEWRPLIMHARLSIRGCTLMASDRPPGDGTPASGFSVMVAFDTTAEAERVFGELAAGGKITMAMGATFWAKRFGMVVDRFGIPWMINGEMAASSSAA
ncbi:MAG: VOC family protein [Bryobacterales bacterium]|nr:VOC family protein [Bryobacterales bacterium]